MAVDKPSAPWCEGCVWPGNCGCFDPPRGCGGCGLWVGVGLTSGPCTRPEGHDNGKHEPEEMQR